MSGCFMTDNNLQGNPEYSTPFACDSGRWPARELLRLDDGYETGVFRHRPASETDLPPVLYLHGIQSHPGWFFGSASQLAKNGHEVFQVTRRGSGANRSDRGHASSASQLLRDVLAAVRYVLAEIGSKTLAMVGVSWGGKLAAAYCTAADRSDAVASLTLVSPGIVARVDVSPVIKLKIAACLVMRPRAEFNIPLDDPELFTDNEPMREFLRTDKLAIHQATARFMYASRRLDSVISRAANGSLSMPVTLILSKDDRIIDSDATAKVVTRLTGNRAEIVSLDGKHTLEFQEDPSEFYRALGAACAK